MDDFRERTRVLRSQIVLRRIQIMRKALDWATIYYSEPVTKKRYLSIPENTRNIEIAGVLHDFTIYEKPSSLVLNAEDGWYVRLQDPDWEQKGPIRQHGVEIQARGRMWAGGRDIWRALDDWEEWLELKVSPEDRIPGRIDLAADVWIKDPPGSPRGRKGDRQPTAYELYRLIIAEGDDQKVSEIWATQSRMLDGGATIDIRAVGRTARTMYLGHAKGIQLVIYLKTVEFQNNTVELLKAGWKENSGWDPDNGLVARFEFRFSREAIREQEFPVLDKETGEILRVPGNKIHFEQLMEALPDIWNTCLDRIRFAPYDGRTVATRMRPESELWTFFRENPPMLAGPGYGEGLTAVKRGYDVEELRKRAVHTLINIEHALGPMGPELVMRRLNRREPEDEMYRHSTSWNGFRKRWKHGTGSRDRRQGERILEKEGRRKKE